jgi:hypothetical protein
MGITKIICILTSPAKEMAPIAVDCGFYLADGHDLIWLGQHSPFGKGQIMTQSPPKTTAYFSQPIQQILLMLLALGLVSAGAWLIHGTVIEIINANLWLNGAIAGVFAFGVITCFWQVFTLGRSVRWIERFAQNGPATASANPPQLLAPLAQLLRGRDSAMQISPSSARSIQDSVASRIDEARDITRYLTNLLVFLGLLGTFYGLATTVPAVVETIRALSPQQGETGLDVFSKLMGGLENQLGGMGTAFSSSLLGLAGSLVIGLLELFAGHGQNRFYRELEEWLSTITHIGMGTAGGAGDEDSAASLAAMMGEMTQTMARLTRAVDQMAHQPAPTTALDNTGLDAEARMRLRSIDVQLLKILEEMSAGRQESTAALAAAITSALRVQGGRS